MKAIVQERDSPSDYGNAIRDAKIATLSRTFRAFVRDGGASERDGESSRRALGRFVSVAIAGMHRSGTSLVAQALRSCGLYLGDESALIGPDEHNPAGYWEHRDIVQLNDRILARLGGSWESPPAHPVSWPDYERLSDLRNEARSILDGEFAGAEHWGWKDPRNSLTLPFWLELEPDLLVVMCVRNPLEVAESLDRRGSYTRAFSLRLWQLYTERLLAAAPPRRTIVTHYNAWFADPSGEAARVARFLGLAPDEASLDAVASLVKPSLRNHLATTAELEEVWPSGYLVDIYRELCRVESNAELMAPAKSEEAA